MKPGTMCAHNVRHGLASGLISRGHELEAVQKMLRQSHVDTTLLYVHNQKQAREAQADFLEKFLPSADAKRVQ